jgi:hypothetical protein
LIGKLHNLEIFALTREYYFGVSWGGIYYSKYLNKIFNEDTKLGINKVETDRVHVTRYHQLDSY